jgi:hypothetical protein
VTLPVWTTNPYTPLSLTDIEIEFVGNRQNGIDINLSDYYSDSYTGYVSSGRVGYPLSIETPIPTIGNAISISNFYGASSVSYAIFTDKESYNEGEVVIFSITAPLADNSTLFWEIVDTTVEIIIGPATLPNGRRNIPYLPQNLTATGGVSPYTWSVSYGSLPPGMTLAANGRISGTPTSIGSSLFAATVLDSDDNAMFKVYSLNVESVPIQILPTILANAVKNVPYTANIVALEGQPPYTYSIFSGFLPMGLTLSNSGVVSGTPTTVGTSNFTIKATDANTNFATKSYALQVQDVALNIGPAFLDNGKLNSYYEVTFSTAGGSTPYLYTVVTGVVPPGLTLNSQTGILSGRPTQIGTFSFTVKSVDFNFNYSQKNYTLIIENVSLSMQPGSLPNGTQNITYTGVAFTAEGGVLPYVFTVSQGALPAGLTLTTGGLLSGKPTVGGSSAFSITVTDGDGNTKTLGYTINIAAVVLTVGPSTLSDAFVNVPYSVSFTGSGGVAPFTFSIASAGTAAGLSFSNGAISGTPTSAGTWVFNITVTDANGNTGGKQYTLNIFPNAVVPTSIPLAIQSAEYLLQLSIEQPYGNYTFTSLDPLPAGITLSEDGLISGTPQFTGQYQLIIQADSDIDGAIALIKDVAFVVAQNPWVFTEKNLGMQPIEVADGTQLVFDIVAPSHVSPSGIVRIVAKENNKIIASAMVPLTNSRGTGYLAVSRSMLAEGNTFTVHIVNGFEYVVATYGQVTITDE